MENINAYVQKSLLRTQAFNFRTMIVETVNYEELRKKVRAKITELYKMELDAFDNDDYKTAAELMSKIDGMWDVLDIASSIMKVEFINVVQQ